MARSSAALGGGTSAAHGADNRDARVLGVAPGTETRERGPQRHRNEAAEGEDDQEAHIEPAVASIVVPHRIEHVRSSAGWPRRVNSVFREAFEELGEGGVGPGLREGCAAVDDNGLARDVARAVGREEEDHFRDFIGFADAS